jgi:hypothetical protein
MFCLSAVESKPASGSDRGNYAFLIKKGTELGLQDQVILAGFVTQGELVALYRKAVKKENLTVI